MEAEEAATREVAVNEESVGQMFFQRTRDVAAAGVVIFFLLFFLLASGDFFLLKLAHVLPRFGHRRRARQVSRYLLTFGLSNLGLGAARACPRR